MHSQGCGLCGCPLRALALARAPARLLSDARGTLRGLPSPWSEPRTQSCCPPSLSAESRLVDNPQPESGYESATFSTTAAAASTSTSASAVASAPFNIAKSNPDPLPRSALIKIVPTLKCDGFRDDALASSLAARILSSDAEYSVKCEFETGVAVAVLRTRAQRQVAKVVLANLLVDQLSTYLIDSCEAGAGANANADGNGFGRVAIECLDASVCKRIFRRVEQLSAAAADTDTDTDTAQRRPLLFHVKAELPLTNEQFSHSETHLTSGKSGEGHFARGCDIQGSKLPQSDCTCDTELSSFNFVENPILSDSFKSFIVNCINDDKTPFCDQLFFQLLFYLNVIGLNLLSLYGDTVKTKDEALYLKLTETLANECNLKGAPINHACCSDEDNSSELHYSQVEGNATPEQVHSQHENNECRDRQTHPLRDQNFFYEENSKFEKQTQINRKSEPEVDVKDAREWESNPCSSLIDLSCDKLVERGCKINQSAEQGLDFINDLIPCYEQLSRTDEELRGQIDVKPHFLACRPETNPIAHHPSVDTNLPFDFGPSRGDYLEKSTSLADTGLLSTGHLIDAPVSAPAPAPFAAETSSRWDCESGTETEAGSDLNLRGFMSAMKQKNSMDEMGREDGSSRRDAAEKPLKSALKRGTKKSGHRVKFDESMNKFFDADYVILVREDSELEDRFGEVCECGDEFCDGRYYEDEESDDDDFILSNCPCAHGHEEACMEQRQGSNRFRPSSRAAGTGYDFSIPGPGPGGPGSSGCGSTFEPPLEFVDQDVTLSPPDGYKDGCCSHQFPESSHLPVTHAHLSAHQKFVRDQESVGSTFPGTNYDSKPAEMRERIFQNDNGLENPLSEDKKTFVSREQETPTFVPETTNLKFSNLYNQGKLSPNSLERNLGLKLKTLNSNQSLKPNSAVRQLFPSSNFILPPQFAQKSPDQEEPSLGNSYARFVPNSSLFHTYTSIEDDDDDDGLLGNNLFRKTIEKNSLRRSLIRYPKDFRKRKCKRISSENSLTERIKRLTCDIDDDDTTNSNQNEPEQSKAQAPETSEITQVQPSQVFQPPAIEQTFSRQEKIEKSEKPTVTSQSSSTASTMSSTYKKLTDLFSRKSEKSDSNSIPGTRITDQEHHPHYRSVYQTAPDLGNGLNISNTYQVTKGPTEARKQFLSSLAPLTACVSGNIEPSSPHGHLSLNLSGNRNSVASVDSNTSFEYSLNDIDEALGRTRSEPMKLAPQPDVIAGTPAGNSDAGNNDELALFVQQDAGRIERIKNRYSGSTNGDSDEDNDDYGFHRRPSVRGIKPRFGSTTEIIQQIQSQLQPPAALNPANIGSHMTWPYYTVEQKSFVTSDTSNTLITTDTSYSRNHAGKFMNNSESGPEAMITQPIPYANRYSARASNVVYQQDLLATSQDCPIFRNQRMVQMHLSPLPASQQVRFAAPGPQFKHEMSSHYLVQGPQSGITSIIHVEQGQQQTIRVPYPTTGPVQVHLQTSRRSESPILQNQHSISVRSTQTSGMPYYDAKCAPPYYSYGPLVYVDHSRPSLSNSDCLNSNLGSPMSSVTSSPTKSKPETSLCAERGVPEGAASVPLNYQQDTLYSVPVPPMSQETVITLTPTSQPNSSVYYAMNV